AVRAVDGRNGDTPPKPLAAASIQASEPSYAAVCFRTNSHARRRTSFHSEERGQIERTKIVVLLNGSAAWGTRTNRDSWRRYAVRRWGTLCSDSHQFFRRTSRLLQSRVSRRGCRRT